MKILLTDIREADRTPPVQQLLEIIHLQQGRIRQLEDQVRFRQGRMQQLQARAHGTGTGRGTGTPLVWLAQHSRPPGPVGSAGRLRLGPGPVGPDGSDQGQAGKPDRPERQ